MKLENKVIVITGGVRDIGREVSKKLAAEGAKLAINYFGSEAQAASLRTELAAMGAHAIILKGDMTNAADVETLVSQAVTELGGEIDGLVNVVGGLVQRKTLDEMDQEFFEYVLKLNLTSTCLLYTSPSPRD